MLETTLAGSLPKPAWLAEPEKLWAAWRQEGAALEAAKRDAALVWLKEQEDAGIDIVSDGEQRREYYITYVTRALGGLDYKNLAEKKIRSGRIGHVGRCTGPIRRAHPTLESDVRFLAAESPMPFKITLPVDPGT